jgi:hypothetical protein
MKILLGLLLTAAPMVADEQHADERTRQLIQLAPLLNAVDLNRDGSVSAEELEKAVESIRSIDRNGDGIIQPEERSLRAAVAFHSATRAEDEGRSEDVGHDGRGDDNDRGDDDRDHDDRGDDDRGGDGRDRRPESKGPRGDRPDGDRGVERGRRPDSDRAPDHDRRQDGERQNGRSTEDGREQRRDEDRHDRDSKEHDGGPETRNRFVPGPGFGGFGHQGFSDGGFGGRGSFGGGFGGGRGFGPGPMPFGRPDRIAQKDGKHESGKPDSDQPHSGKPQMLHRPDAGHDGPDHRGPDHKPGHGPAPMHRMAGRPAQPMHLHAAGGSTAIVAILFRLLDANHNGSLSLPEFQRISDGLHSGPSVPAGPSMFHSQGPRGPRRHRIAERPQVPKIHGMPHRPEQPHRGNHRGPDGSDSQPKPDHDRGPDSHRGPDRGDHKPDRDRPDGARPTEAKLQIIESDWI